MTAMKFLYDDGGRSAAGYSGSAGDCATRAIAIATGKSYQEVYDGLNGLICGKGQTRRMRRGSARTGTPHGIDREYLQAPGWTWTPTMKIGSGCKVHLKADELPAGRLIVSVSRHLVAVIDGVIHDTHDPSREGTRCVYGYYRQSSTQKGEKNHDFIDIE